MKKEPDSIGQKIGPVLKRYGVLRASVFGSRARGDATPGSDLDLLVEFEEGRTLFDLLALRLELEEVLGHKVDVLTYPTVHPRIRTRILEEQVPIL
jgi:predicted nucleotidyltransferase